MKIRFGRIYPEVNTSFDLSSLLLNLLREHLDKLGKELQHYRKMFENNEYALVLIISATRKREALEVKGPILLRKRSEIEFALHIPYQDFVGFEGMVSYLLPKIGEGLVWILKKYKTDPSGVDQATQDVLRIVLAHPEIYKCTQ